MHCASEHWNKRAENLICIGPLVWKFFVWIYSKRQTIKIRLPCHWLGNQSLIALICNHAYYDSKPMCHRLWLMRYDAMVDIVYMEGIYEHWTDRVQNKGFGNDKIKTGEVNEDSYFTTEWISFHNLLNEKPFFTVNATLKLSRAPTTVGNGCQSQRAQ